MDQFSLTYSYFLHSHTQTPLAHTWFLLFFGGNIALRLPLCSSVRDAASREKERVTQEWMKKWKEKRSLFSLVNFEMSCLLMKWTTKRLSIWYGMVCASLSIQIPNALHSFWYVIIVFGLLNVEFFMHHKW